MVQQSHILDILKTWYSKSMFKCSEYMHVKDGMFRMFVRWLYAKVLDELYIPKGTEASCVEDDGRKLPRPNMGCIKISATSPSRKGNQEHYFFEEIGFKSK
jgi:hypothetical protein